MKQLLNTPVLPSLSPQDPEVLAFQRDHPQLFFLVSDRERVRDPRLRDAVGGLLRVREIQIERALGDDEANAMATQCVVSAMGNKKEGGKE